MNKLWITCGAGILTAIAVVAVSRSVSTPPVYAASEPASEESPFSETWISAAAPLIFKNTELARVFAAAIGPPRSREDSEPVKAVVPVEMAVARTDVRQTVGATESVRRHRNICQRHGMRKVKHGRRGWRCRR
jgi:hypothetical protein